MLKTGIISSAYFAYGNHAQGLKKMRSHGYDCMDFQGFLSPDSPLYALDKNELAHYLKELKSAAKAAGIEIWQMHGMWPHDDATKESRNNVSMRHKTAIEAAGKLGCKYLVIHPAMPFGWGDEPSKEEVYEINAERFLGLLPVAKENGVTLCIENMPFRAGHSFSTVTEVKDFVLQINDASMKACFDTGHCNVVGANQYEAIKTLGDKLACLHVHDDTNRQDRHLIPFQGEIDWNDVVKGLREIKFDGCISLETQISRNTPEPMREQMQRALASIARYVAEKADMMLPI